MNEIISILSEIEQIIILIPWIAMYYITWHLQKEIDQ